MRLQTRTRRGAFTLIELLVVIGIIAVLISLLAAGVMKALSKGPEATTRIEIGQLSQAIEAFKTKFKVPYVPSRIRLCEKLAHYTEAPSPGILGGQKLDNDSIEFLTRMFPRLNDPANPGLSPWTSPDPKQWVDWNGNGVLDAPSVANNFLILEGDQALVFFLGGIPTYDPNGCLGFSTNPRNPAALGGDRITPFYEFKSTRLRFAKRTADNKAVIPMFFSYYDGYNLMPYAYFSSYKSANGYNRYYSGQSPISDCNFLRRNAANDKEQAQTVWPYVEAANPTVRFQKPDSYQIISAGADGVFGQGTDPRNPVLFWPSGLLPQQAKDDQANFAPRILDAGQ
jgi:prepilin-type N-terminal cleavage/methylation domain-containing protein